MDMNSTVTVDQYNTAAERPAYVAQRTPLAQEYQAAPSTTAMYAPEVEVQRQEQLRLQLLYARIEQDSGRMDKAKERVAILKKYYPGDPQLLSYEASLASASGQNAKAINILRQAQMSAPDNEDIPLQITNLRRANASSTVNYVKLDHTYRGLGDNRENITTLEGAARVAESAEVGFNVQNDFLSTENTRRASDGAIGDYDYTRQRGELYAAHHFDSGERLQASLFGNNETAGAGGYLGFSSALGRSELLGEYHRPYWDFVEAVAEHATRDRVGVKHFANLSPTTSMGLEASVNNYNIEALDDVRKTSLLRLSLIQQLQGQTESQPYFGVGYGFDGEYKMGTPKTLFDSLSNEYSPFPLVNREIHSLTGIYQNDFNSRLTHLRLVGGAAYDRFGGAFSPLVDGRIAHDVTDRVQIGAHGRYAMETSNTDNRLFDIGADVMYKF